MGSFRDLVKPRALRILLPVGLVVAAISGWRLWTERQALGRSQQIDAVVLATSIDEWSSGTGTSRRRKYKPVVHFRFQLDGKTYESRYVTPLGDSGSRSWAHDLVGRYTVGEKTKAWVDPANPTGAFLVRVSSWKPPLGIAFGSLIAIAAAFGLLRARRSVGAEAET